MPTEDIDGIMTRYEVVGSGPPLLMFSPGGFDATMGKWRTLGAYSRTKILHHLSQRYACIIFDRREAGESGGRVERISWEHYARQGRGLLERLNIERAHVMGGCMGCSPAMAFGVAHPETTLSLVLYWPVGGAKYRINGNLRFAQHLAYVQQEGLAGVVSLASDEGKTFGMDPRVGPWGAVIARDPGFADSYAKQDVGRYTLLVMAMGRALMDRDSAPGAEPEDLLRLDVPALVIPGRDDNHATSAARYLEECLPRAEYWDAPVEEQTEQTAPARVLDFLNAVDIAAP